MERIAVTIKIDPELWKEMQHRCIDEHKQYSEFVEQVLKEALRKKK